MTGAHKADWCITTARTRADGPVRDGLSMFLVDMTLPGVNVVRRPTMNGWTLDEITFDGVRLTADALLGERDAGWRQLLTTVAAERSGMFYLGFARHVLDDLDRLRRATTRDGRRLADDPLVRDRVARLDLELAAGLRLAARTRWSIESGTPDPALPPMAKVYATELLQRLAQAATEIAGHAGLVHAPLFTDARAAHGGRGRPIRVRVPRPRARHHRRRHQRGAARRHRAARPRPPTGETLMARRPTCTDVVLEALEHGRNAEPLAWHNTVHLPRLVLAAFSARATLTRRAQRTRAPSPSATEARASTPIATARAAGGRRFVGTQRRQVLRSPAQPMSTSSSSWPAPTTASVCSRWRRDSPGCTITPLRTIGLDEQCDIALDATPATLVAMDVDDALATVIARGHRALRRRGGRGDGRARSHRRAGEDTRAVGRADRLVPGCAAPVRGHAHRRHHRRTRCTTLPVASTAARDAVLRRVTRQGVRDRRLPPASLRPPTSSTAVRASTPTSPSTSGTGGSRRSSPCTALPTSTAPWSPPPSSTDQGPAAGPIRPTCGQFIARFSTYIELSLGAVNRVSGSAGGRGRARRSGSSGSRWCRRRW